MDSAAKSWNRLREIRLSQHPPWTQDRLIHELQIAARRANLPAPNRQSLKVQVSRWENGHTAPGARSRQLLRLAFRTTDADLGFAPSDPAVMRIPPIPFQADWITAFDQAAAEWSLDMERRTFVRSSMYVATASTEPALQWLLGQPEVIERHSGSILIGEAHIASIREVTAAYRKLDNRFGGGQARASVIRYLGTEVGPIVRNGVYDSRTGKSLLSAVAETLQLAGWMTYDAGLQSLGQRYMTQALRLALAADDDSLGAEILAGLSHQASYLKDGRTAIDLARASAKTARRRGLSALSAEAAVMEAHGHAVLGDESSCTRALSVAEAALDKADRSSDPCWISYFDEAYVSAKFGHCFKELRKPKKAEQFALLSLKMDDSYVRGKAFNLGLLATAHAQAGQVDAACSVGHEALNMAKSLHSARANEYIRSLSAELRPFHSAAKVRDFSTRVATELT